MKISKKGIESIIDRLYTIEEYGNKVINPRLLNELLGIISRRYNDAGYIIKGDCIEVLEIYKITKNGIKTIFRREIGKDLPHKANKNEDHSSSRKNFEKQAVDVEESLKITDEVTSESIESDGRVVFIANSILEKSKPEIFEMEVFIQNGLGNYACKLLKRYVKGMNSFIEAVKSFFTENTELNPVQYDYNFELRCKAEDTYPRQIGMATELCLKAAILKKHFMKDSIIVVTGTSSSEEKIEIDNIQEICSLCLKQGYQKMFLPKDVFSSFEEGFVMDILFYEDINDLFDKAFS